MKMRSLAVAAIFTALLSSSTHADCQKLAAASTAAITADTREQLVEIMSGIDPRSRPYFHDVLVGASPDLAAAKSTVARWIDKNGAA